MQKIPAATLMQFSLQRCLSKLFPFSKRVYICVYKVWIKTFSTIHTHIYMYVYVECIFLYLKIMIHNFLFGITKLLFWRIYCTERCCDVFQNRVFTKKKIFFEIFSRKFSHALMIAAKKVDCLLHLRNKIYS